MGKIPVASHEEIPHPREDVSPPLESGPNSGYGSGSTLQEEAVPVQFPPTAPQPSPEPKYGIPHTPPTVTMPAIGYPWTTGLFDCHEHQTNAIMTAFFPCVTFGQIAEILDNGDTSCPLGSLIYVLMMPALCSQWIMGSMYRAKLRKKYNLVEAPTQDWISHLFCPCCSLCQEFRELKNRGIDPSLGWMGNLARQQGQEQQYQEQATTIPPMNQSMFK